MSEPNAAEVFATESDNDHEGHKTPGTMALAMVFLLSFAVYYFANWKALADVWWVR